MVDLDLTLCHLKRQGTLDSQDIDASEPVTFKWVTLTTFALEGRRISEMFLLFWASACWTNIMNLMISVWFIFIEGLQSWSSKVPIVGLSCGELV